MSIDRSRIVNEYLEFPTDNHGDTCPIDFAEHIATLSRNEALEEAAQYVDRKCTPTGEAIRALYTSASEQSKPQSNANSPVDRCPEEIIMKSDKQRTLENQGCVFNGQELLDNHEIDPEKECYCGRPFSEQSKCKR